MTGSSPHELLAELLRTARIRALRTQRELADRVGVSERAVRDWESGAARPSLSRVPTLAAELELDATLIADTIARTEGTKHENTAAPGGHDDAR